MSEERGGAARVRLHIGELVLDGFPAADRYRIADALEHELARLLAEESTPAALTEGRGAAELDAGAFTVAPGSGPEAIGSQIGRAIYRRLG
jgi:hypothetical protein